MLQSMSPHVECSERTKGRHLPLQKSPNAPYPRTRSSALPVLSRPATMAPHLWLRAEVKPHEHRTPLTPATCAKLIAEGFELTVERSQDRIVPESEYEKIGCRIVPAGTWTDAPADAFIVGLKELPESGAPLRHRHIYFGHAYKNQEGWRQLLGRFVRGGGRLLDMEFLMDDKGRRVAAFGYMAGFAGSAVGLQLWAHQRLNPGTPLGTISAYPNDASLIACIKGQLELARAKNNGQLPRIIVIGALGRCGSGAVDFALAAGIPTENIVRWDMAETRAGGPFPEILAHDIMVNCIYLSSPIPPFITREVIDSAASRQLSVIVDVSCDTTNPHNPIPIYNRTTTFDSPALTVPTKNKPELELVAIDHLPTLLPLESSGRFADDMLPSFLQLKEYATAPVWTNVSKLFDEKSAGISQ